MVIIGGGFGGLYTAKSLKRAPVKVTIIDRRNFHLFQPLLYQVAIGGLSPGDIGSPIRSVLKKHKRTRVVLGKAIDVDPQGQVVKLTDGEIHYDTLIVATGLEHYYFGNDQWASVAPGLKDIEDALEVRRRILLAFEAAEREQNAEIRRAWQTFVLIGGGPTGVELAGAIGELARNTLKNDFRSINPLDTKIIVLEAADRILQAFPPVLSLKAEKSLMKLGVTIQTNSFVTEIQADYVSIRRDGKIERIPTKTVLWTAGVQASSFAQTLVRRTGADVDRNGRIFVQEDLSLPGHPDIIIVGDLANYSRHTGESPPGMAPVAMQQGRYAAKLIDRRLAGKQLPPFRYFNKGSLAVIGRNAAVADFGFVKFNGFFAWLVWIFVHIAYLIEYDNRLLVLIQWAWNYLTRKRGARLVTGDEPFPLVHTHEKSTPGKKSAEKKRSESR